MHCTTLGCIHGVSHNILFIFTFRAENAVNFLTAWNMEINKQDIEDYYTPLHLAVISGNPKIIRRLLIKGANRMTKDKNGKTAIDLAR